MTAVKKKGSYFLQYTSAYSWDQEGLREKDGRKRSLHLQAAIASISSDRL